MSTSERIEFFGLKKVEFSFYQRDMHVDFRKYHPSKQNKGRYPYSDIVHRGIFDGVSDILASNYVLILSTTHSPDFLLDRVNLSFALLEPTSTGGYLGFREGQTDVSLHYRITLNGPFRYLHLNKKKLIEMKGILNKLNIHWQDSKFKLNSELYLQALEGGKLGLNLRFLSLVIALENLYMPRKESELSFKLGMKVSNILCKCVKRKDPKEVFKLVKDIYKVRSAIAHHGKKNAVKDEIFHKAANLVRESLLVYLDHKDLFKISKPMEDIIFD